MDGESLVDMLVTKMQVSKSARLSPSYIVGNMDQTRLYVRPFDQGTGSMHTVTIKSSNLDLAPSARLDGVLASLLCKHSTASV